MTTKAQPAPKVQPTTPTQLLQLGEGRLRLALKRMLADAHNDLVPDLIDYRDYRPIAGNWVRDLLKRLRSYQPKTPKVMDVPKSPYLSRPGAILDIEDRLLFQAIANRIAPAVEKAMPPRNVVYGFRVGRDKYSRWMFGTPIGGWLAFRERARALRKSGFEFMVVTDLTAFFEHIEHDLVLADLERIGVAQAPRGLLGKLLEAWTSSEGHGLPQGHDPSSLLANLYLARIDRALTASGVTHARYMDDFYLFAHSETELRKAMQMLVTECRERSLSLNAGKTKVLRDGEIDTFLSKDQDIFQAVEYAMDVGLPALARVGLKKLLQEAVKRHGVVDERKYKFTLNRLGRIKDPRAIARSLATLIDHPQLADTTTRYLKQFMRRPTVVKGLVGFLRSDANIYPWQEMWILRALFAAPRLNRADLDFFRLRAQATDHEVNQALCIALLGRFGTQDDLEFCLRLFGRGPVIDKAIVLCAQHLPADRRETVYVAAGATRPELRTTVGMLRASATASWPS